MAIFATLGTPANISNALSQVFENEIVRQINREQATLRLLPKVVGSGKNLAWDVEGAGALAAEYAEAADVAEGEFGVDDNLPATLSWGLYRAPFRVTGLLDAAAMSSHSPSELRDVFREKMFGAVSRLGAEINKDIWIGVAANEILGLHAAAGGLLATGTYAGINRATSTFWQGNVLANGAVPRPVSFSLMRDLIRTIYVASGMAPDVLVTDPIQFDKIASLFDSNRRWMDVVSTGAGMIRLSGGERALDFDGIPIVRDKDHPVGAVSALNTRYVAVQFLPTRPGQENGPEGTFSIVDDQNRVSGLPARVELLGKTGDHTRAFVKVYPQVKVRRPNACGILSDLS